MHTPSLVNSGPHLSCRESSQETRLAPTRERTMRKREGIFMVDVSGGGFGNEGRVIKGSLLALVLMWS